ncbi:hypothetical protein ACTFIZ_009016 [Dictyostelium cf. discoideum]
MSTTTIINSYSNSDSDSDLDSFSNKGSRFFITQFKSINNKRRNEKKKKIKEFKNKKKLLENLSFHPSTIYEYYVYIFVLQTNFKNQYAESGECYFYTSIVAIDSEGIENIDWVIQDNTTTIYQYPLEKFNGTTISPSYFSADIGDIIFYINITSKNPSSSQTFPQKIICYDTPKNLTFIPISNYSFDFFKSTYSIYFNITGLKDNTDPPRLSTFNTYVFNAYLSFEFNKYKITFRGVPDDFSPIWSIFIESDQYDLPSPKKSSISYDNMTILYEPSGFKKIFSFDYPQYWFTFKPIERYPYINVMESPFKPKVVSSNSDGSFNYFINLKSIFGDLDFELQYQNYSKLSKIQKSYNYTYYHLDISNITTNEIVLNNNRLFNINCIGKNQLNRNEIGYTWEMFLWDITSVAGFPFGYGSGNNNEFIMDFSVLTTLNLSDQGYKLVIDRDRINFNSPNTNLSGPTILDYSEEDYFFNVRRVYLKYSTQFGISRILLKNDGVNYKKNGIYQYYSTDFNILSGDLKNGELEFFYQYNIMSGSYFGILVTDINSISTELSLSYPALNNFGFNVESISNISFLFNDVNLTNSYGYNIMYLETNDSPLSFDPYLQIIPQWDNITINGEWINSRYEFKFFMPPNIVPGDFEYAIRTPSLHYILNTELPDEYQLNVICDRIDLMGPIVTTMNKNPSLGTAVIDNENYNITWTFTISDYNGFDNGYVVVIGSIDNILYNASIVSPIEYSTEFTYQVNITLNSNICISQTYSIAEMVLYDRYGLNSTFFMNKAIDYAPNINPLFLIKDKSLFSIETECPAGVFIQPELKSFDFEPKSIDVGSLDRDVTFTYEISIGSGIKEYPIVYLTSTTFQKIKCTDVITTQINSTINEYKCTLTIPYGFGLPQDIMVNLYGLIGFGSYFGYSSSTLRTMGYPFLIETSFTAMDSQSPGLITGTSSISTEGGSLLVYGKFPTNSDISVEFSQGYSLKPSKKSGSIIKVDGVKSSNDPFSISIKNGNSKSNLYTITPYKIKYFRPVLTSKCRGTPICGGPTHGTCDDLLGCICNSPWVGVDCNSKVIVVPQPEFNNSSPSIVLNETTTSDNSESSIVALVSVVAIREIDYNNKVLHMYSFDKWDYISNNSKLSTYSSNIINKNGSTTPISVNIEYFEDERTIEFAGQEINMKPSSIKYTIYIDQYPFSTRLSQLQLILSATAFVNSDSDSCSNKEFDSTTSQSSDFIKLSILNKSLYGRLIKRALVDSVPITISNELLDKSLGSISDPHTSQSFIGINIPIYNKNVIIDPDFSLLLNSNPSTTNENENSICSPKSSSGLSKAQLAGIIVGCSVAAIAITFATIVTIYKKKVNAKQMKAFSSKLKTMSEN